MFRLRQNTAVWFKIIRTLTLDLTRRPSLVSNVNPSILLIEHLNFASRWFQTAQNLGRKQLSHSASAKLRHPILVRIRFSVIYERFKECIYPAHWRSFMVHLKPLI